MVAPLVFGFFIERFFTWMPGFFLPEGMLGDLGDYSRTALLITGALFTLFVTAAALDRARPGAATAPRGSL